MQIDACHARMLAMESQIQEMPLIGECKVNFADDIMVRELCEVMHSWRQGFLVIRRVKGGYRSVSNVSLCYSKLETLVPLPLSHAKMI